MNRRRFCASMAGVGILLSTGTSAQTPESTPSASSPLVLFHAPLATNVEDMTFRCDRTPSEDVIRLNYTAFTFAQAADAESTYNEFLQRIMDLRENDLEANSDMFREISIGKLGDERIGFIQEHKERIYGFAVLNDMVIRFSLVHPDPIRIYGSVVQPILENTPTFSLDLADFPAGWRYEWGPEDVTKWFVSGTHRHANR